MNFSKKYKNFEMLQLPLIYTLSSLVGTFIGFHIGIESNPISGLEKFQ